MFRLRATLALACGLALVGSACSSSTSKELDLGKAETSIRKLAVRAYSAEAHVGGVKCPKRVLLLQGATFTCTVAIDGQPLLISLKQKDDKGNVRIDQAQAVIFTTKVESFVASYATDHGSPTSSVSCGEHQITTRSPGEFFTCSVVFADGTTGVARLQVKDTEGKTGLQSLKRT